MRISRIILGSSGGGGYTLTCDSGSFSYTGTAANLERGYLVSAESGAFTWSGTDAGLTAERKVTAESGSFSVAGTDTGLLKDSALSAESGSFTWTGTPASLERHYTLTAESGSFPWTGSPATLSKSGSTYTLTADAGVYEWIGSDAALGHSTLSAADLLVIRQMIFDEEIEPGINFRQLMKVLAAGFAGDTNGAIPGQACTVNFRDPNDLVNRIVASIDANGNRTVNLNL